MWEATAAPSCSASQHTGYSAAEEGENVFASAIEVFDGNAAFEVDWGSGPNGMQSPPGHRNNDHDGVYAEVGIGIVDGTAMAGGTNFGPLVCTMDFGTQTTYTPFVTGVVYYDLAGTGTYAEGEGLGGVSVNVTGASYSASTANSGGYSVPTSGAGTQTVTFSVSGLADQQFNVNLTGTSNVKVDLKLAYTPPVVSGTPSPPVGQQSTYQFTPLPGATSYQFKESQLVPFATVETGASGTSDFTVTTTGSYNVIAADEPFDGNPSFHLADQTQNQQSLELNFALLPTASSDLQFESLLGYATNLEVASAQVSTNGGSTWQILWSDTGTNTSGDASFNAHSISLSAFAGEEIMVQFVYSVGSSYYASAATGVGFYIDNIQVTNSEKLTKTVFTPVTSGTSFQFEPTVTGSFALSVQPEVLTDGTTRFFPFGPDDIVATPGMALPAPSATTDAANPVGATTATLNGSVNPNGAATTVTFQYGLTTSYGTTTSAQAIGSGASAVAVNAPISGLSAGMLYHFQVTGSSANGVTNGGDLTFTTNAATGAPAATTEAATNPGTTSATLNGSVNPNGASTTVTFQYGLTNSYGTTTAGQAIGSGTSAVAVNAPISGLSPGTLYHFQVTGSNADGVTNGGDLTFTTSAGVGGAPTVTTEPATNVTATSGTLNGTVNPNGSDTIVLFEYGLDTTYKTHSLTLDVGSGTGVSNVFLSDTGLQPNTTYHFRLTGSNANGVTNGGDQAFTTAMGVSFGAFKDKYVGIISTTPATNLTTGIVAVSVGATGSFSAAGELGGKKFAFKGKFDPTGNYSVTLKNGLQVKLQLVMQQTGTVEGTVTAGGLSAGILLEPVAPSASTGELTLRIPHPAGAGLPQGNGYGTLKVRANSPGAAFTGKLGDGTPFTFGSSIVTNGSSVNIPVYIPLYKGQGFLAGLLTSEPTANGNLDGVLNWFKPETAGAYLPAPFNTQVSLFGSTYVRPMKGQLVINLPNGTVTFNAGDLANPPLQKAVTLGTNDKITVTDPGADKLKMSINISTGLFSGSFVGPDAPKATSFSGALFQDGFNFGTGVFKGPADPGSVDFQ